ncbi:hypothetical protein PF005_g16199 [Phytophthora fragariae]|uniref:Uncharacterized protein n=1 Tax=Phytophthora fragariae TaxID=53985 RepID=A0A6A3EFX7_9STRA|nr:hypothetical protein PF009_g20847 [Phytophthora fragariae]KAE9088748.1 hypothetical protein PF007_g19854 [Phytophthora fragariae]KAE9095215.1 hypothetical protein PF006_g24070 [Phytophthora fragariae]KAE9177186.1 hypothetical protein PF004_g25843 [Phytophthora fragariae]KAE9198277.1 hypothetical protein PF005_g16199 [Phytophthora fragariae]
MLAVFLTASCILGLREGWDRSIDLQQSRLFGGRMAGRCCGCEAGAASARHSSSLPAILLNCDPTIQSKRIGLTDYSTLPNR